MAPILLPEASSPQSIHESLKSDDFEVLRDEDNFIGNGSSGLVYKAKLFKTETKELSDDRSGTDDLIVAAKIFRRCTPKKEFIREARNWLALLHPNIHECFGFCFDSPHSGEPIIFSRYHSKGNVLDYIREVELSENKKLMITEGIVKGMCYLHNERSLMHGDLKSSNVLIGDCDTPLITDFGTGRVVDETMTMSGQPLSQSGSLRWQSPERLAGKKLTKDMDVYAFGITCFEIFTSGQIPFGLIPNEEVISSVKTGIRPRLREELEDAGTHLQEDVCDMVELCWHQEYWNRPKFSQLLAWFNEKRPLPAPLPSPSFSLPNLLKPPSHPELLPIANPFSRKRSLNVHAKEFRPRARSFGLLEKRSKAIPIVPPRIGRSISEGGSRSRLNGSAKEFKPRSLSDGTRMRPSRIERRKNATAGTILASTFNVRRP